MTIRYWRAAALLLTISLASPAFAVPTGKTVRTSDPAERFAAMDIQTDGKVTWEEFSAARPNLNRHAFDMIDADHNASITLEEWKAFSSGHGGAVKAPDMSAMMKKTMEGISAPAENLIPDDHDHSSSPAASMPLIMPPVQSGQNAMPVPSKSSTMPLIMPPKAGK